MFIISMKMNRKKKLILLAGLVLVVGCIIFLLFGGKSGEETPANSSSSAVAGTINGEEDVRAFLESFGWEVSSAPIEEEELTIPTEFNDVYEVYNTLQKKQGYDLEPFRGKEVKRYCFEVLNYPEDEEHVRANVLVADKKVIGGDVSSVEIDGFMHGFTME